MRGVIHGDAFGAVLPVWATANGFIGNQNQNGGTASAVSLLSSFNSSIIPGVAA